MDLFLVGRWSEDGQAQWEVLGVYNDETKAILRCKTLRDFVGQCKLNEDLPEERIDWPGAYYPLAPRVQELKMGIQPEIKQGMRVRIVKTPAMTRAKFADLQGRVLNILQGDLVTEADIHLDAGSRIRLPISVLMPVELKTKPKSGLESTETLGLPPDPG